jgi:hypothetical protein
MIIEAKMNNAQNKLTKFLNTIMGELPKTNLENIENLWNAYMAGREW